MWKVYTDVGGINNLNHFCPPVRKIIHKLKSVDCLHVRNSYTMGCPAVRRDNPRALASGLITYRWTNMV